MQRNEQWAGKQEGPWGRSTTAKHKENGEDGAGVQRDEGEGGRGEQQVQLGEAGVCDGHRTRSCVEGMKKEQNLRGESMSLPHRNQTGARGSRLQGQLTVDCRWQHWCSWG